MHSSSLHGFRRSRDTILCCIICPFSNTVTTTNHSLDVLHLPVSFNGGHCKSAIKSSKSTFCLCLVTKTIQFHFLFHFVHKSSLLLFSAARYLFVEKWKREGAMPQEKHKEDKRQMMNVIEGIKMEYRVLLNRISSEKILREKDSPQDCFFFLLFQLESDKILCVCWKGH